MQAVNLYTLVNMLKTVLPQRDYKSPRAFLECKFFNKQNEAIIVNNLGYQTWTDLSDGNVISEMTRSILGKHMSPPRHCYAVTKLILFQYKGVLYDIEASISRDLETLGENDKVFISNNLKDYQQQNLLPLLNDYKIGCDNLAQAIVACVLHCFLFDYEDKQETVKHAYSKGNIVVLKESGVSEKQFKADFPDYSFAISWDELAKTHDCDYYTCSRCKHKCVEINSNYNVKQLLKLYLKLNVKANKKDNGESEYSKAVKILDTIIDQLSSEMKSEYLKLLIRQGNMSADESIDFALNLMRQDGNNENEN